MTTPEVRSPDRWLFYALLVLIAWLPVPLGSIRPFGYGVMQIISFSLLSCWLILQLSTRRTFPAIGVNAKAALLFFLGSLGYHLLQVIPLPLEAIRILSPAAYQVYDFTLDETFKESFSISLDIGLTLREFLRAAAYTTIFFLVLVLVNSRKRLTQLAYLLVLVGFAEALFGLLDASLGGVLFRLPFTGIGGANYSATGTFITRTQFGGLLEMAIPISAGLIMAQTRHHAFYADWRQRVVALSHWLMSKRLWLPLYLLAMVIALLYSTSRGATFSLVIAVSFTSIIMALNGRLGKKKALAIKLLVMPLAIGVWLGGEPLLARLADSGLENNRHVHREAAYKIIADYPVFGAGAGNWKHVYMSYKDPETYYTKITLHTHNDYLELLVEQGIIGFLLFGSGVLVCLGTMVTALRRRRDPLMRGLLYGCVTATLSLLIHSLVDFNLQEASLAAWFSVILAMGLIAARMPHDA